MFAKRKLFLGIVLALLGGCESTEAEPVFVAPTAPVAVAELTPILGEPMVPSEPRAPELELIEAAPAAVAPPPARRRRRARTRRPPSAPAFYPHGKPVARLPELSPAPPVERPGLILRGGPRWGGRRIGAGRVRVR